MTTLSEPVEIYCLKCRAKTASQGHRGHHHEERPRCHPVHLRGLRHQEVPHRRSPLTRHRVADSHDALAHPSDIMALDLGLTTRQLLSARDGVAQWPATTAPSASNDTLERRLGIPASAAAGRTAAVGRRP